MKEIALSIIKNAKNVVGICMGIMNTGVNNGYKQMAS